jgi:hypothetical protein
MQTPVLYNKNPLPNVARASAVISNKNRPIVPGL